MLHSSRRTTMRTNMDFLVATLKHRSMMKLAAGSFHHRSPAIFVIWSETHTHTRTARANCRRTDLFPNAYSSRYVSDKRKTVNESEGKQKKKKYGKNHIFTPFETEKNRTENGKRAKRNEFNMYAIHSESERRAASIHLLTSRTIHTNVQIRQTPASDAEIEEEEEEREEHDDGGGDGDGKKCVWGNVGSSTEKYDFDFGTA